MEFFFIFNSMIKDLFSERAGGYATYRPAYPKALTNYLLNNLKESNIAWDCATGNGQMANMLAPYFDSIFATDISASQLSHAIVQPNIIYSVSEATSTHLTTESVDLITVAQAIHWFNIPAFYTEAKRVLKRNGLLCLVGYNLLHVSTAVNAVIEKLYTNILDGYWQPERKIIDDNYTTIAFPFQEINVPYLASEVHWSSAHLLGYLRTWSAVQKFEKENGTDPVTFIEDELIKLLGREKKHIMHFPLIVRAGFK